MEKKNRKSNAQKARQSDAMINSQDVNNDNNI